MYLIGAKACVLGQKMERGVEQSAEIQKPVGREGGPGFGVGQTNWG